MDRVAGEEYAAFAVVVREEQVLLPLAHVEHVVFHGHADGALELPRHVLVLADDRVERPVPSRILHDQERRRIVGDMVMPPFPGTVADRDALVQIVAAVQRLAQQGRLVHCEDHVDVHRRVAVQPGGADLPCETHAPEDFHRAGVPALHLGKELRRFLALDQRAAHALLAEIDGERQSDRPGADDQDLGIRSHDVIIYAVNGAALILEQVARKVGVAAAWTGIPLMVVLVCIAPGLRWAGRGGDLPFGEASTAALFALTMTSFGYAYAAGAHVRLDVLSRRF